MRTLSILLLAIAVRPGSALGQGLVADTVTVVVLDHRTDSLAECKSVRVFRSKQEGDLKDRFVGCKGTRIPYGVYELRFASQPFDTTDAAWSPSTCIIDQKHAVCFGLIALGLGHEMWAPLRFVLEGVPKARAQGVTLIVNNLFYDGRWSVSVDGDMRAEVLGLWSVGGPALDVVVSLVLDGKVVASVYCNRPARRNSPIRLVYDSNTRTLHIDE
jgi:hypothetical protein